jgi:hypothetical protein
MTLALGLSANVEIASLNVTKRSFCEQQGYFSLIIRVDHCSISWR